MNRNLAYTTSALALLGIGWYVVTKVLPARTRSGIMAAVGNEVARQLSELRPDLTDPERALAGAIVASQAALETDNGATPAWVRGWNFSNLTAGPYWTGATITAGDTAPDAAGNYMPISQRFRSYPSLAAAVSDYLTALSWPQYRAARDSLMAGDAAGFARNLHSGGWYTAPEAGYEAAVVGGVDDALGMIA